jgi:hypothetical protein
VVSEARPAGTVQKYAGAISVALLVLAGVFGQAARAETAATPATPAAAAAGATIAIELNKVEMQGNQCRAYFVVTNKNAANYKELKLDLVVFRPDGVIGRRFAVDLAPLKPNRRVVKLFELADTACDDVGSFFINEVTTCQTDSGPVEDCFDGIAVSSLAKAQLTK